MECDQEQSPGWCDFGTYNPGKTNGFNFDLDTNWHVFDFVWTSSQLSLYQDGIQVGSTINDHYVNPMFLIFQIQAGGIGSPVNKSPCHCVARLCESLQHQLHAVAV